MSKLISKTHQYQQSFCMKEENSYPINSDIVSSSTIRFQKCFTKQPVYFKVLLAFFVMFISVWTIIVLGKYYSLHSNVFDLGYVMERLWQPYHIISFNFYTNVFFSSGFQFIISPLYFFHSFQLLLIVQVVAIGASCLPLYGIAVKKLGSSLYASIISIAYLFYFPSYGVLWFDVHFQSFFIPLFITAYYLYITNHYRLSTILFIVSGTVRFPYMIFPFLFSLFEAINNIRTDNKNSGELAKRNSILLIFLFSILFLAGGAYFDLFNSQGSLIVSGSVPFIDRLLPMALTIIFILGPLLFLPIIRMRWFIMSLPLFLLGLYSGNPNYTFPLVFQEQYTSMVVPIVFIGLIEALVPNKSVNSGKSHPKNISITKGILEKYSTAKDKILGSKKQILVAILLLIFIGSIFNQPYSPVNYLGHITYNSSKDISFNTTNYNTLMSIIHLIPKNNPYVLFQNDMPELLPRPPIASLPFLFTVFLSNNITLGDVVNNSFPISTDNGHFESTKVDYLLAYTQSSQYYLQFNSEESTLPQLLSLMLVSQKYGILAEEKGFILVERDYIGPPKLYEPLSICRPFNVSNINGVSTYHNLFRNKSSTTVVTLVPGNYTVKFYISVSNNSSTAFICGALGYNNGANLGNSFKISASYFQPVNSQKAVTFNVTVPNQESNTVFVLSSYNFVGNITIYKVSIVQTSY